MRVPVFVFAANGRAGVVYVGKYHARPTKYVVFEVHIIVNRYVVLDPDVVTYDDITSDKYVLSEDAALSNLRTSANMNPMPDASALADCCTLINDRGFVDRDRF
jgi:hypothetical protein